MASTTPKELDWEEYHSRWNTMWDSDGVGLQPGQAFDKAGSSPALLELLSSGALDVKGKSCLVPGCGRGYDVESLAQAGAAAAVGLELAPLAVEAARAYLAAKSADEANLARMSVECADFLDYSGPGEGEGAFDVGYDYTFLCALHPDMRQAWAQAWRRHLKPGGLLVTLIFPVDPDWVSTAGSPAADADAAADVVAPASAAPETDGDATAAAPVVGPPWPMSPDLYSELLTAAGFACQTLTPVPSASSHPSREGREHLGIWKAPPA